MPTTVKAQWDFGRFFIIIPAATGFFLKLILDSISPALGLGADAGNYFFLGIWGGAILYMALLGIAHLALGPDWMGVHPNTWRKSRRKKRKQGAGDDPG